jgi:hypothetical protein
MITSRYKAFNVAELREILDEIIGDDDPTTFCLVGTTGGGLELAVRENVLSDKSKTYDIELR